MAAIFQAANCSVIPASTPSDAGIAGAGVLLSFMITAALALVMSASLILQDFSSLNGGLRKPHTIRRKLLNSYSDQQIVTGIGIQSVGLAQVGTLVPYHFFLIWMLGLLSTAVHNAALLALVHDFRRDWVLRWLRQVLMFANLALSCVYGVYILRIGSRPDLAPTLPVACAWDPSAAGNSTTAAAVANGSSPANAGLTYVGTAAVILGNCLVFGLATWYLHSRAQRFYKAVQLVGIVLMAAIAVGATIRIVLLSQAFGSPSVALADAGETQWSFGQLLSLLLLLLPLVSVVEIYRGEIHVAAPVHDSSDALPLFDGGASDGGSDVDEVKPDPHVVRSSFQPNPFFGSQASLFKK